MKSPLFPRRRTSDLLEQEIADEILLYDERRHLAFCLNGLAAAIWTLCDGSRQAGEIASLLRGSDFGPVEELAVRGALDQLLRDGLLDQTSESSPESAAEVAVPAALLARRRLLGGLGAGAALALPAIAMLATPAPAQAYNGCVDCSAVSPSNRRRRLAEHMEDSNGDRSRPAESPEDGPQSSSAPE